MFRRQEVQVEKLQMCDLIKNPIVQKMVMEAIENATYQKLFEQMSGLWKELDNLKDKLTQTGIRPT